ncbi:flagellar FliJ family protein [Planctomonas psychrotolerans]|uniref:flagellar FliJ family protein n=1 Tax=Planctomonas psychrotolerans TaxID=2528712 RepID=UPI001239DF2B|nr:flagellar FliJ family protein [Planctomonas psychrotolerans]
MARTFALAGLLRLRHVQEDEAQSVLAAANARAREAAVRSAMARAQLENGSQLDGVFDSSALLAVAAARSSARSMLAELDAVAQGHQASAEQAQVAFSAARARSIGLEKLEQKHNAVVAEEDVRSEQIVLDEIASTAWNRGQEDDR